MTVALMADPYNKLVRQYFANPVHAGGLPDEYNDVLVAEASESGTGARVVFSAVINGETIRVLRYQILGCPHLIAAAEAFCDEAEGQTVKALSELNVQGLMDRLEIPVEKAGRLFILEDAAKALHIRVSEAPRIEG